MKINERLVELCGIKKSKKINEGLFSDNIMTVETMTFGIEEIISASELWFENTEDFQLKKIQRKDNKIEIELNDGEVFELFVEKIN